jgi:hypothetical protein
VKEIDLENTIYRHHDAAVGAFVIGEDSNSPATPLGERRPRNENHEYYEY